MLAVEDKTANQHSIWLVGIFKGALCLKQFDFGEFGKSSQVHLLLLLLLLLSNDGLFCSELLQWWLSGVFSSFNFEVLFGYPFHSIG
ncbi:hypothetical protein RIF29_41822 [Crotalaria pallida]|uniref:Uncharacterized protein n=1 Tax=Crotalaria pallida TaxID=3830 RepID=A0AAN9E5T5_CROPI